MTRHNDIGRQELRKNIKTRSIQYAGNFRLKIFGLLSCRSGKKMKSKNRIFFKTKTEALAAGFRPCGHCMRDDYRQWKLMNYPKPIKGTKFNTRSIKQFNHIQCYPQYFCIPPCPLQ